MENILSQIKIMLVTPYLRIYTCDFGGGNAGHTVPESISGTR